MLSATVFADDRFAHGRGRERHQQHQQHQQHGWHQGHTGANCDDYGAGSVGGQYSNGRYELQSVQKWVPGSYVQVWVAQQCSHRHHGRRGHRCTGGHYVQQWQAGRYETVQEWVFVPHGGYPHYGAATVVEPPPAVGFGLTFSSRF